MAWRLYFTNEMRHRSQLSVRLERVTLTTDESCVFHHAVSIIFNAAQKLLSSNKQRSITTKFLWVWVSRSNVRFNGSSGKVDLSCRAYSASPSLCDDNLFSFAVFVLRIRSESTLVAHSPVLECDGGLWAMQEFGQWPKQHKWWSSRLSDVVVSSMIRLAAINFSRAGNIFSMSASLIVTARVWKIPWPDLLYAAVDLMNTTLKQKTSALGVAN